MRKILITRKLIKSSEEFAKKFFEVKLNENDNILSKEEIINRSQGCDGVLSSITDKFDSDLILKLPNTIKIISNFAVGFGNIDIDAAKEKNIVVTNTPDVLTDATAEIAMLILLGAARRAKEGGVGHLLAHEADEHVHVGEKIKPLGVRPKKRFAR